MQVKKCLVGYSLQATTFFIGTFIIFSFLRIRGSSSSPIIILFSKEKISQRSERSLRFDELGKFFFRRMSVCLDVSSGLEVTVFKQF